MAIVTVVQESQVAKVEPRYELVFTDRETDLKVRLKETELLELFEPIAAT